MVDRFSFYSATVTFFGDQLSIPRSIDFCKQLIESNQKVFKICCLTPKLFTSLGRSFSSIVSNQFLQSKITKLRLHSSPVIHKAILDSYVHILQASAQIAQSAVDRLFEENQILLEDFAQHMVKSPQLTPNPLERTHPYLLSRKESLSLVTFNFVALGHVKRLPIAQKIIDRIAIAFHPFKHSVMYNYPLLQTACLTTLRQLSKGKSPQSLQIACEGLQSSFVNGPKKMAALEWIQSLLSNEKLSRDILPDIFLQSLFQAGIHAEERVRVRVAELLYSLVIQNAFGPSQLSSIARFSMMRLGDFKPNVRLAFLNVLAILGPSILLLDSPHYSLPYFELNAFVTHWMQQYQALSSSTGKASLFSSPHFQRTMGFVSQRTHEGSNEWINQMFYSSQPPEVFASKREVIEPLLDHVNSSDTLAYFWAAWESARHLIAARLRTHFGNPSQTFENIERMVIQAASLGDLAKTSLG